MSTRRLWTVVVMVSCALAVTGTLAWCAKKPTGKPYRIGALFAVSGPAAPLGVPERNTALLLQDEINKAGGINGHPLEILIEDTGSEESRTVLAANKLMDQGVLAIVGPSQSGETMAIISATQKREVPLVSCAASVSITQPAAERKWVFKTPQSDSLMADAIAINMKANGVKTMGYIGFADGYGDGWLAEMRRSAATAGIKIVGEEKYNRTDASVTGQVLKLVAANPDAILIAAAGTPGATPQKDLAARNYKGKIYQTHGVANPDFLRVVGKDGNGTILPIGPMLVFEQLPDSNPLKKSAAEYINKYEAKFGKDSRSTFGGHAWDASVMLSAAIPEALKKAKPGTKEFRLALRDALENMKEVVATHGVYTMSPTEHNGLDNRARTMIKIENGKWVLAK